MANQLGKRYVCEACGSSVLCTKSGDGEIDCCEKTMEIQEPRKLPSSDFSCQEKGPLFLATMGWSNRHRHTLYLWNRRSRH